MFDEWREINLHFDSIFVEENSQQIRNRTLLFFIKRDNFICSENKQSNNVELQRIRLKYWH